MSYTDGAPVSSRITSLLWFRVDVGIGLTVRRSPSTTQYFGRQEAQLGMLSWCLFVLITSAPAQQPQTRFSGVGYDANGAAVAHASVEFAANGNTAGTETAAAG